jgi:MFS family permease
MAGCDAHNLGGDNDAARKRVANWAAAFALIGAIAVFLNVLGALGWVALLAIAFGAVAGAAVGFFVGSLVDWFTRLKTQSPESITIAGKVKCAGRNPFGLQPWTDGDWTCNMGELALAAPTDLVVTAPGAVTQVDEVRLRAASSSGLAHAFPSFNEDEHTNNILHCEISSHIGSYSVVGGAVGSVAGAAVGIAVGIAACIAAGIFTFGIGTALCALILAVLAAAGAVGGGLAGEAIGSVVGWIADELSDFDKNGKTIESSQSCLLFLTGTWVTDTSHQHNEIHEIKSVQVVDCGVRIQDPGVHPLGAVVAIGRQPAGTGNNDIR